MLAPFWTTYVIRLDGLGAPTPVPLPRIGVSAFLAPAFGPVGCGGCVSSVIVMPSTASVGRIRRSRHPPSQSNVTAKAADDASAYPPYMDIAPWPANTLERRIAQQEALLSRASA